MRNLISSLLPRRGFALAASALLALAASAAPDNPIVRLLNSRASGSPRTYAEAAAEVAEGARKDRPVHAFVLALISREPDAPPAAKLSEEDRKKFLDASRERIYRSANKQNNSMAWYLLSLENNDTNLLVRAADGGNVQAQNAWGSMLVSQTLSQAAPSNVVQAALAKAHGYFSQAAGKGDPNGLYNLGMCHARGLGVPRNDQSAFKCFRAAAEQGHPEAINNIGWFFREGKVVDKDLELATKWFAKSASYDNPFGQFNYALALQRGEGVKPDPEKAAKLLEAAANAGCVEAIDAWGVALWKGNGVKEDPERAFRLLLRAANAGYPPAMENVSTCYEMGKGVRANATLATEWKIRSRAARGDRNAQAWLQQNEKNK